MARLLAFRSWLYFRTGWSTYFAFIFAAINTLTVTYFLAIERYPLLFAVFPTFQHYVVILTGIGIPVLVLVGYIHFKRSSAFRAERDIGMQADPYFRRILVNTEIMINAHIKLSELMLKLTSNEQLTEKELEEIQTLQKELKSHSELTEEYKRDRIQASTLKKLMDQDKL
mgnify:FL=1